jgi:hypothetical protein
MATGTAVQHRCRHRRSLSSPVDSADSRRHGPNPRAFAAGIRSGRISYEYDFVRRKPIQYDTTWRDGAVLSSAGSSRSRSVPALLGRRRDVPIPTPGCRCATCRSQHATPIRERRPCTTVAARTSTATPPMFVVADVAGG